MSPVKQPQPTEEVIRLNKQRVLARLYQKKFIERREKQMKIINKQIDEGDQRAT